MDDRNKTAFDLKSAEEKASEKIPTQAEDSLDGALQDEESARGFYSGDKENRGLFRKSDSEKNGKGKSGKKGKIDAKGILKKKGPLGIIFGLLVGTSGMMMGMQSMLPVAIEEMIIEKFNSIGVSSTVASDSWLDTQLNLGIRGGEIEEGDYSDLNLFGISEWQVQSLENQGFEVVVAEVGERKEPVAAILYERDDSSWVPVVGSMYLSQYPDELQAAVQAASKHENVQAPVSVTMAFADDDFKIPYITASKTWRGGVSGWFDGVMEKVTTQKLSLNRNRWVRYARRGLKDLKEDFLETARVANIDGVDGGTKTKNRVEQKEVYQYEYGDDNGNAPYGASVKERYDGIDGYELESINVSGAESDEEGIGIFGENYSRSDEEVEVEEMDPETGEKKKVKKKKKISAVSTNPDIDNDGRLTKESAKSGKAGTILKNKAMSVAKGINQATTFSCTILEGIMSVYTLASGYEAMQYLNMITGFLEAVDKMKTGNPSPYNEYGNSMTAKADTINRYSDTGEVVAGREGKTAMESAGMGWLFNGTTVSSGDVSVRNNSFQDALGTFSKIVDNASMTVATFDACGYIETIAQGVDVAITIASYFTAGFTGVVFKFAKAILWNGVLLPTVTNAISTIIGMVAPGIVNLVVSDVATEWFGEDLGNAVANASGKYLGGNGTSGQQSPGSKQMVVSYMGERDTVIAEEARYQRSIRSPFDITSPYTFLGSLAYAMIPIAFSGGGIMSTLRQVSSLSTSMISKILPTAGAISQNVAMASEGDCPLLASMGIMADAYCNPYIITDVSTIRTSPVAVNDIVYVGGDTTLAATSGVDLRIDGKVDSDNFETDENGKITGIKDNSDLAKYITYCGERTSPYGVRDGAIADKIASSSTSSLLNWVPIVSDGMQFAGALTEATNYSWVNGSNCVASENNKNWEEFKWYQRFGENMRLVENMNPGYTSIVTAYLEDDYEKNPIDDSFEGTLARFSGMTKDEVEDTLALIEYMQFLDEYDASERYAFGDDKIEKPETNWFDSESEIAETYYILVNPILYADVRNRQTTAA